MFKKEEEINIKNAQTIIGPSIKVRGNFSGDGDIVIEGTLEGSVKTSSNLYIGEKSLINADIEAKQAKISGEIHGNLKIQNYLEITASAKIYGDIMAGNISIEKGAVFNGSCNMGKEEKGMGGVNNKSKKEE